MRISVRPKSVCETKSSSVAVIAIAASLLVSLFVEAACAQAIPRRIEQLQTYRGQITPPPLSPTDTLRQDIIQATNPQTGNVDVGALRNPRRLLPAGEPNVDVGASRAPRSLLPQSGGGNVDVGSTRGSRRLLP